jgi:hypothetical protein
MFFLFLLLTAACVFFLFRTGRIGPPPWAGRGSPETEAKKVLAERSPAGTSPPTSSWRRRAC